MASDRPSGRVPPSRGGALGLARRRGTARGLALPDRARRPLQEQVDALVLGDGEAEPLVEPKRRVHPLDVDRDALPALVCLGEELLEQPRPDPVAALLWQERDVDDTDLARATVDVKPPRRLSVDQDHVEARLGVVLLPPGVLRVELHAQERVLLRFVPRYDRELLRPRARVDAVEELSVARLDRAYLDGLGQPRGGKTPWSAMLK